MLRLPHFVGLNFNFDFYFIFFLVCGEHLVDSNTFMSNRREENTLPTNDYFTHTHTEHMDNDNDYERKSNSDTHTKHTHITQQQQQ